jgi:phosphate transport system protein
MYHHLFQGLVSCMTEDPQTVRRALHLVLVVRDLERIADHATNVAEGVVYYLEAEDIRHTLSKSSEPRPVRP